MEAVVPETRPEGRGLRRNAVGLLGLIAQSVGVTAPEISAVVIAAVVATKIGAFTPLGFIVAAIGAIGLALVYGRFARYVPSAGGTYAIVRAGLGRDVGFLAGWILLAVGIIFVPGLLIASAFLLQNFFQLTLPHHPFLFTSWWGWAFLLGAVVMAISYFGVQISVRTLLALTAIGVTLLLILDIVILAKGGAHGWAWASISPWSTHGFGIGFFALGVGIAMTGFSGFETAVFLAEEAHTPKREVPKAVLGAVLLATAFFIITTFAIVTGYGMDAAPFSLARRRDRRACRRHRGGVRRRIDLEGSFAARRADVLQLAAAMRRDGHPSRLRRGRARRCRAFGSVWRHDRRPCNRADPRNCRRGGRGGDGVLRPAVAVQLGVADHAVLDRSRRDRPARHTWTRGAGRARSRGNAR